LHGVKANEVKILVIAHTVRPASNQGAPDDAPEFALAPTTYNRKRNLIISKTQIIFRRKFRKEEDILDMCKIIITLKLKLTCIMIQFLFG